MIQKALILILIFQGIGVVLAQHLSTSATYYVQNWYTASGCAPATSNQMKIFPLGVCIQGGALGSIYSCDASGNPSVTNFNDADCLDANGAAVPITLKNCVVDQAVPSLFMLDGCMNLSTIATKFIGSTSAEFRYVNQSTCLSNPVNGWTWVSASTEYCRTANAGVNFASSFSTCSGSSTVVTYCAAPQCAQCDAPRTYPLDQSCQLGGKSFCLAGIPQPASPQGPPTVAPSYDYNDVAPSADAAKAPNTVLVHLLVTALVICIFVLSL